MRKHALLAAVVLIALLPAGAAWAGGRHYDRGDRYRDWGHSRSFFGFSIGVGSDHWRSGFSYRHYDGPSYYRFRYVYRDYDYCPPPVIYYRPVYTPPPVIVYPAPRYYYYDYCPPSSYYYSETRFYYGR
ncbi:hypothetical protein [Fontivita pretiosa]|uniref:hypothetical protein n=1 Tax=Fontivita pretiosa TaxID=2989684 RepID=UPI003D173A5C